MKAIQRQAGVQGQANKTVVVSDQNLGSLCHCGI
jgi:hypothetical protein